MKKREFGDLFLRFFKSNKGKVIVVVTISLCISYSFYVRKKKKQIPPQTQFKPQPKIEPQPQIEDKPQFEPKSQIEDKPQFEPKPQFESKPQFKPKPANQLSPNEFDAIIVQEICNPTILSNVDSQNHMSQFAQPKSMELINQLLDNSSRKRNVDENLKYYLIETLEEGDLYNYYLIKKLQIKKQLSAYCTKMIHVRGDGNCFYTSFGYQLLKIVIYQYSDEEFDQFLQQNFTIPFKIQLNNISFGNVEQQGKLLNYYKNRIIYLRNLEKYYKQHEHYSQQLARQFRAHQIQDDLDGYFQPLTTLFLRNLSMHIVEKSEDGQNVFDKENLLKWEEECNNNEQVIAMLAKHLRLHIQLIFFADKEFKVLEYSKEYENQNRSIILLIKPGHYNIGFKS